MPTTRIGAPRRARAPRCAPEPPLKAPRRGADTERSCSPREINGRGIEVDTDDVAAGGSEHTRSELADEPQPDDTHPLSYARVGLADAVECYRTDGRIARVIQADSRRNRHDEILGNRDGLSVIGPAATSTSNAVAGCEAVHALADLDHQPCA